MIPLGVGLLFTGGIAILVGVTYGAGAAALVVLAAVIVAVAVALAAYRSADAELVHKFAAWADSTTHAERVAYSRGYVDGLNDRGRQPPRRDTGLTGGLPPA